MRLPWKGMSLARQLLLLQAVIILAATAIAVVAALLDARNDAEETAGHTVTAIAGTVSESPVVIRALESGEAPSSDSEVQAYAESVRLGSGTDFVVVMRPDRTRLSHPTLAQIGRHFIGNIDTALDGRAFTETYTGTLGPSVRAVVPVMDQHGEVIGLVSVGILLDEIGDDFLRQLPAVLAIAALAFGVAAAGTYGVSRRLRRQTRGMGPTEITRMYEYWDAVLHSVHEGLLVVDNEGRVQLANDEATRLLALPAGAVGRKADDLPLPAMLRDLAASGRRAVDELHLVGVHTLVVNQKPAIWEGDRLGTVMTFRDQTELTALTGELDTVRGIAEAMRAQTHEAANRLHTVISLVQLDRIDEAVRLATAELQVTQQLTDRVMAAVADPVLSALLLGKASQASERGVDFVVSDDTSVGQTEIDARDLVTVVGNLVDNALDAAQAGTPPHRVTVAAYEDDGELVIQVSDTGPGLEPAQLAEVVQRGWTTKPAREGTTRGLGLALVDQVVRRHGGAWSVERDEGAVFVVRLPLLHPESLEQPVPVGEAP